MKNRSQSLRLVGLAPAQHTWSETLSLFGTDVLQPIFAVIFASQKLPLGETNERLWWPKQYDMLAVIILFTAGFFVGLLAKRWLKSTKPIDRLVTIAIWLLLFILGVGVGGNKLVMGNLHTLGLWALIIAVGSIAGSIAVVALVERYIFKKGDE